VARHAIVKEKAGRRNQPPPSRHASLSNGPSPVAATPVPPADGPDQGAVKLLPPPPRPTGAVTPPVSWPAGSAPEPLAPVSAAKAAEAGVDGLGDWADPAAEVMHPWAAALRQRGSVGSPQRGAEPRPGAGPQDGPALDAADGEPESLPRWAQVLRQQSGPEPKSERAGAAHRAPGARSWRAAAPGRPTGERTPLMGARDAVAVADTGSGSAGTALAGGAGTVARSAGHSRTRRKRTRVVPSVPPPREASSGSSAATISTDPMGQEAQAGHEAQASQEVPVGLAAQAAQASQADQPEQTDQPEQAAQGPAVPKADGTIWTREQHGARQFTLHGLVIFAGSLALFLLRFLVPSPVGMADNGDGPRLMCGLGVSPVTGGNERYDGYAYFRYALSPHICGHASVYQSSEHLLLVVSRWLTPILGLPGVVSLVALGILTSAIAAVGVAAVACALASTLRCRLAVAGLIWLVMADAAFFDTFASPYSEGATLVGLLLVVAGLAYLGRGGVASAAGMVLAGAGGYLTILSKEQYLTLAVPVCGGLLLAATGREGRRGIRRFLTWRMAAAVLTATLLGTASLAYAQQDADSPYTTLLHQEQVVDVIFTDIVNVRGGGPADWSALEQLGLPGSWASYAGDTFWSRHSVYDSPLYKRYDDKLTDGNLAHYLLVHPVTALIIAQHAATSALNLRVNYLGTYAPGAGQPPGTLENRVGVISSLVGVIPSVLGLFWLIPVWAAMIALAVITLRRPRRVRWHHDASVIGLCLTGCAIAAFVPAAFFAGVETTRHMLGSNMATALAFAVSATLLASLLRHGLAQDSRAARSRMAVSGPRALAPPAEPAVLDAEPAALAAAAPPPPPR
jgi:hypothetical protein